jgi:molybdate transport system permease protein
MHFHRTTRFWLLTLNTLLAPAGVAPAKMLLNERPIIVFSAAGATDVVTQLCREYEGQYATKINLNLASSSTLARQIEAGAQADIFISANTQWMEYVHEKALMAPATRADWATNRLALVAIRKDGNAASESALSDNVDHMKLTTTLPRIEGRIAIGDPDHVPVGMYAREALESVNLYEALRGQFVACPSVRAALRLVETGQVEAGIVYQSDALTSERVAVIGVFPQQWREPITFQIALSRRHHPSAASLLSFLRSKRASQVLVHCGFTTTDRRPAEIPSSPVRVPPLWKLTEVERVALAVSLKVAVVSVLLLTGPGILLGYILARKDFPGKAIMEALVHAPLVLPPIVTGYLLLLVLGTNSIVGHWLRQAFGIELAFTFKAAALASAVVALPLMVRSVRVAVAFANRGLEKAAHTLGAGPVRTFLLVTLPLAAPGVIAGMVLAFARSLGEFGATAVFMGNIEGQRTLPLAIYSALQSAHGEPTVWKLVVISVVASMAAVVISEVLARRAGRYLERSRVA